VITLIGMSRGPGSIEKRIADLLALTRDRVLDIDAITDHAFGLAGAKATRAQRLSATRAAHRVLRRVRENSERSDKLLSRAHANTKAALGRDRSGYGRDCASSGLGVKRRPMSAHCLQFT
jgi:hypothetical protein